MCLWLVLGEGRVWGDGKEGKGEGKGEEKWVKGRIEAREGEGGQGGGGYQISHQ